MFPSSVSSTGSYNVWRDQQGNTRAVWQCQRAEERHLWTIATGLALRHQLGSRGVGQNEEPLRHATGVLQHVDKKCTGLLFQCLSHRLSSVRPPGPLAAEPAQLHSLEDQQASTVR